MYAHIGREGFEGHTGDTGNVAIQAVEREPKFGVTTKFRILVTRAHTGDTDLPQHTGMILLPRRFLRG